MEQTALLPAAQAAPPEIEFEAHVEVFGIYRFAVPGEAVPQGSMVPYMHRGLERPMLKPSNEKALESWRKTVADYARHRRPDWLRQPWDGPVGISILFRRERSPNDLLVDGQTLRAGAARNAATAPDGDKLDRAVWDALTDVLFTNDSRVIEWAGRKRFGNPGQPPAALVDVYFCR